MKRLSLMAMLFITAGANAATFTDYARVVDVRPVQERVTSRQCDHGHYAMRENNGGGIAGTLVGGLVGGVVGNQIGRGRGNTLATVAGALGGAVVGNNIGRRDGEYVRDCDDITSYQVIGYDVTYDYRGMRDTTRTTYDPGVGTQMEVSVHVDPLR